MGERAAQTVMLLLNTENRMKEKWEKRRRRRKFLFFFPFGIFPHVLPFFGINKKKPVFSSFLLFFFSSLSSQPNPGSFLLKSVKQIPKETGDGPTSAWVWRQKTKCNTQTQSRPLKATRHTTRNDIGGIMAVTATTRAMVVDEVITVFGQGTWGNGDIFQKMTQKSIIHAGESENRPVKSDLLSSSHLKKINHPSGLLWTSKQPVSGFVITRSVLDFEDTCISWKPALSDSFREFPEGLEDKIVRQDHGRHYSNGETNRRGARPELSWNIYACVLVFRK